LRYKGEFAETMLLPYRNKILARKQRNNMNVAAAIMKVKDVAKRAWNSRKGDYGVSIQYVLKEIQRENLKAEPRTSDLGTPYYVITEEDFLAWEEKRGRSPGDEP
jgi:hypothetical protein